MRKLTALLLALITSLSLAACSFVALPMDPGRLFRGSGCGGSGLENFVAVRRSADGRTWTECDINTLGARSRGPERIAFSNDGLIYYTGDHYQTFELLYGGE